MLMRNVLGACEPEADVSSLVGTHEFAPTSQYPGDKVKTPRTSQKTRWPTNREAGLTVRFCIVAWDAVKGDLIHNGNKSTQMGATSVMELLRI
jgi:hypothetical protein